MIFKVEKYDIPCALIIIIDLTPIKYFPFGNEAFKARGERSMTFEGSVGKRSITGTFVILLYREFILIQLIYGAKTTQILPRFQFQS